MDLSKQQIEHIAQLARLELSDEELERYGGQLSVILGYIDMLNEVDTDGIEPTAQVTGLSNVFRGDQVFQWDESQREAALKESPDKDGRFIKVKKVFE